MNIPNKIKIAGYTYDVELNPGIKKDDMDACGLCHFDKLLIEVNSQYPKQMQDSTFIHEVLHAIEDAYEIGLTEKQVARLESGIYALLVDNKIGE